MLGTFPIKIETCWQEIVVVQIVKLSSIIFVFYFLFLEYLLFSLAHTIIWISVSKRKNQVGITKIASFFN